MTYPAEINRRYDSRDAAWSYLASRGFACGLEGWRNGRWRASIGRDGAAFQVRAWLPSEARA
ncbi:MAG TPA: hypothetical protein VMB81_08550 [Candidatus Sulfotelmatobacter sp.]|nr:hypothetical protein [Candidatus Sulfotelmatobacter sp.]